MDKKYTNITQETPDTIIEGTPISELPEEIINYYMENEYGKKGIPLSAKTIKGINEVLEGKKIKVDLGDYGVHYVNPPPMTSDVIC